MRVELIDPTLASAPFMSRHNLISTIVSRGHYWAGPGPDEYWMMSFLEGLGPVADYFAYQFFKESAWGTPEGKYVAVSNDPGTGKGLNVVNALLSRPLELLVENSAGDGELLRSMLSCAWPEVEQLLDDRLLLFAHAGGKAEAINQVEVRLKEVERTGVPLRIIALVDSDSKFPADPGLDTGKVKRCCEEAEVPLHVLWKRKIENYLPDRVLDAYLVEFSSRAPDVKFIKGLSATQRDHHPMKQVIRTSGESSWSGQQAALYSGVDPLELSRRKLPGIADHAVKDGWVCSSRDLEERKAEEEMHAVVQLIRENL